MNIEQQWARAKEEFGEDAYRRFRWKNKDSKLSSNNPWRDCYHNNDAESLLYENSQSNGGTILDEKPLADLIAHDIEWYGDKAYLIWKYATKYGAQPAKNNMEILRALKYGLNMSRKTSAALPFDEERAMGGDVVEAVMFGSDEIMLVDDAINFVWDKNSLNKYAKPGSYSNPSEWLYWDNVIDIFSWERLRMRYPRRNKKGLTCPNCDAFHDELKKK